MAFNVFVGAVLALSVASLNVFASVYSGYQHENPSSYLTDMIIRDMMDKIRKDFDDVEDGGYNAPPGRRLPYELSNPGSNFRSNGNNRLMTHRQLESEIPVNVADLEDRLLSLSLRDDPVQMNPSLRDQEYLQHSALWGHQFVTGGAGEGEQRLKPEGSIKSQAQVKTDSILPAYCNPPNPCPVGYTAEDGCMEDVENTAAFSREYQASQDCMCDAEHMFDCPDSSRVNELANSLASGMDFLEDIVPHKTVAKKFKTPKKVNPYLRGEKLPIAAKKGQKTVA